MIGYNDTKAIGLYSIIKITPFVFSSFFISIIISIPAFIFKIYDLLFFSPSSIFNFYHGNAILNQYNK